MNLPAPSYVDPHGKRWLGLRSAVKHGGACPAALLLAYGPRLHARIRAWLLRKAGRA